MSTHTSATSPHAAEPAAPLPHHAMRRFVQGLDLMGRAALIIVALVMLCIVAAPWLAPHDPLQIDLTLRLAPPSGEYWLGNDEQGRDILSRVIYGIRTTMSVTLTALVLGGAGGLALGLLAAYFRRIEVVLMRLVDLMLSFPAILICLAVVAFTGPGFTGLVLALSVSTVPIVARFSRSAAATVMTQDYVRAARAAGLPDATILWRYVLRNALPGILVMLTLRLGSLILVATALGFLGLGIPPPNAELGAMASQSRQFLFMSAHVPLVPSVAILLIVLCINLLGDALRDFVDPRLDG
jgi:ABC-type dipeptide/oligopeptide/nickel transport system permease subunit